MEVALVERRDWTLLVLAAAKGAPLTPVQLQKALFLVGKNISKRRLGSFYKFRPYDYGPFDSAVYTDAESLQRDGLVEISRMGSVREYAATSPGLGAASDLRADMLAEDEAYIDRLVDWVRPLSFSQLVQAIYREYPEMRANSVFRDPAH